MKGGEPTYEECDFVLSWLVRNGRKADVDLSNLFVVLAGKYSASDPSELWHVKLYLDEKCTEMQRSILGEIFLGRAGGTPLSNFASAISEVYDIQSARIELSHEKNKEFIKIGNIVSISTDHPVASDAGVSCGIPGHDHPGQEIVAGHFRVRDDPFDWDYKGRCGFATDFSYKSN